MAKATKRIFVTLEASKADAITEAANDYGMPISSFAGLCLWMGYKNVLRQIDPEKAFTPEQWVDIIDAAKKRGVIDDGEIQGAINKAGVK